jgi:uncharacterized protein
MYPATIMLKPASADCNLDCSYCFYLHRPDDPYPQQGLRRMSAETLEAVMRASFGLRAAGR